MPEGSSYDLIVAGGGPAGATLAALVAEAGPRVLLLEREDTPRFKIGESLIPATYSTLARLGMLEELRASDYPEKHSVQFFSPTGTPSRPFYFRETEPGERSRTWQVLRSDFDRRLLERARQRGAEVRRGATVEEVLFVERRATGVRFRAAGERHEVSGRIVADATGQRAILARQLAIRRADPRLRMAALFTHFTGAQRESGLDAGATLILDNRTREAWFWSIPLPDDRTSVGVVGPVEYLLRGRPREPQKIFDEEVARCPGLAPRLAAARQVMEVRVANDFSYVADRIAGDGWILVGDAFGFLDPIYSTGVLLALRSAELAADSIIGALADDDPSEARLGAHDGSLREALGAFRQLVYAFYDRSFSFARFLDAHPQHREAVIRILIGNVFGADFSALFGDMDRFLGGVPVTAPGAPG